MDGAQEAVRRVRSLQKHLNLSDEALATRVGINQSSVSRALTRKPPAWTPSLHKLWRYAENHEAQDQGAEKEVVATETLGRAALEAWDGTQEGLDRLVRLLAVLREFRQ